MITCAVKIFFIHISALGVERIGIEMANHLGVLICISSSEGPISLMLMEQGGSVFYRLASLEDKVKVRAGVQGVYVVTHLFQPGLFFIVHRASIQGLKVFP